MNEPNPATNNSPDQHKAPDVISPPQASSAKTGSARAAGRGEIRSPTPNTAGDQQQQARPKVAKPDADPEATPAQKPQSS